MNIFVVGKHDTLNNLIKKALETYDHKVLIDKYNDNTKILIEKKIFDVIILNTSNKQNKMLINRSKKKSQNTKILGICNSGTWVEKVRFLNNGGDDVLSYPFPMQELIARVDSLTRRGTNYTKDTIYIGRYSIDPNMKSVCKDNKDMKIRKKEYALLEYLAMNKNRTVSRCELLDHVWDYRKYVGSNTVDVHVKRLRDRLHDKDIIKTIHGVGYRVIDPDDTKAS